ncbi:CRAL-TRIO domain-containing protein, partial [Protomyces lactucae-debilis]
VLKETSPALLRKDFYTLLRHDYPDLVPLRFLKARLYELDRSTRMLLCSLSFRRKAIPVALRSETKHDMDFLRSMKKAKSFVPCYDQRGRTITTIRIKNHSRGDCTQATFENYMIYCMEHAHLLHLPYQDRTVLLVDMTDFSLTALDLTAIKFIIQNFEQNYPEELSEGIIHNAPWLFTTAWAAIKPLLRGPTREKITFTSNENDLAAKLGKEAARTALKYQLEYHGRPLDEDWKDEAADPATASPEYHAAMKVWEDNIKTFEGLTKRWIDPDLATSVDSADEIAKLEQDRIDASWTLAESYWLIDKFVRPSSYYDRLGLLPP